MDTLRDQLLPLEQGLEHLRAGRSKEAIGSLRSALVREPGRLAAVRGLVTAHLLAGDAKSARSVIGDFVVAHPMTAGGWLLRAQLEWKLGDRTGAIQALDAGLARMPDSPLLKRRRAAFAAVHGQGRSRVKHELPPRGEAVDGDWLDEIARDPASLRALLATAAPDSATRDMLRQVERKLAALLESQPAHADRRLLLANLQAWLDDVPAALESVDRALERNVKLIEAHRLRARLLARRGDAAAAVATLRGLLKRGIDWPDIHFEIATLEREAGRAAEARSHLYNAIRLNPRFSQAHDLLERWAA